MTNGKIFYDLNSSSVVYSIAIGSDLIAILFFFEEQSLHLHKICFSMFYVVSDAQMIANDFDYLKMGYFILKISFTDGLQTQAISFCVQKIIIMANILSLHCS